MKTRMCGLLLSVFLVSLCGGVGCGNDAGGGQGDNDLGNGSDGMLSASVTLDSFFQDCMPIVAPDPMEVRGGFQLNNGTSGPVGPIVVKSGVIVDQEGATLATFDLEPLELRALAAGAGEGAKFMKTKGSLMPQMGCSTVRCMSSVRVEVPYSGPGIPAAAKASSGLQRIACVS